MLIFILMGRAKLKDINIKNKELKKLLTYFSMNIYLVRKFRGFTQLDVSKRSGLSLTTIADIEQGRVEDIRLGTISLIATALNVSPLSLQAKKIDLKKLK